MKLIFELPCISVTGPHCGRSLGKVGSFWWEHLKPLVFEDSGIGNWLWVFSSNVELCLLEGKMLNSISQITRTFSCSSLLTTCNIKQRYLLICLCGLINQLVFLTTLFPYTDTTGWYSILFKSSLHFGVSFFLLGWNWMQVLHFKIQWKYNFNLILKIIFSL